MSTSACIVVAVIKPFRLEAVLAQLPAVGARCIQHTEARGYGRQKTHLEAYGEDPRATDFVPKVRLEFEIDRDRLDPAIEAVRQAARTGRIGDGKIFVLKTTGA